jgi:hypothetical protein
MGDGFSSGSTSQFDLPPPPPGREFSSTTNPFGDTVFGTSGLTGPQGSNVFNMELPAPAQTPATMNIAQQLNELQGTAITGHLTTEELNAFNVLKSGMSGSSLASDPSSSSTDTLGTRGFNLCGWAYLHPTEISHLHQCNDSGWLRFTKARNKEERKAVIDAYFVQPLVRKNGRFRQILTTEFRDLIINWQLAPKNFEGSKLHGGLGPLSFVTRTLAEQENLEFSGAGKFRILSHTELTSRQTHNSRYRKTIPGTPNIPDNVTSPEPTGPGANHWRQSSTATRNPTSH